MQTVTELRPHHPPCSLCWLTPPASYSFGSILLQLCPTAITTSTLLSSFMLKDSTN